jgi:hypothetical protein
MNLKEKYEKVKTWTGENKGKVIIGMGIATAFVVNAIIANTKEDKQKQIEETKPEVLEDEYENDYVEMQFVDKETKEVLGKVDCHRSYMEDFEDMFKPNTSDETE